MAQCNVISTLSYTETMVSVTVAVQGITWEKAVCRMITETLGICRKRENKTKQKKNEKQQLDVSE